MECQMCTENDRRGGAGKGSGSKGCRGAEHGQACTKERTGAVAVRAALESAVQVGRGDEGNRQAEMANPAKCRDSLQAICVAAARTVVRHRITKGTPREFEFCPITVELSCMAFWWHVTRGKGRDGHCCRHAHNHIDKDIP
jgi:hypothetical protein